MVNFKSGDLSGPRLTCKVGFVSLTNYCSGHKSGDRVHLPDCEVLFLERLILPGISNLGAAIFVLDSSLAWRGLDIQGEWARRP